MIFPPHFYHHAIVFGCETGLPLGLGSNSGQRRFNKSFHNSRFFLRFFSFPFMQNTFLSDVSQFIARDMVSFITSSVGAQHFHPNLILFQQLRMIFHKALYPYTYESFHTYDAFFHKYSLLTLVSGTNIKFLIH